MNKKDALRKIRKQRENFIIELMIMARDNNWSNKEIKLQFDKHKKKFNSEKNKMLKELNLE